MQKDNLKNETPTDANNMLVAGLSPKKRVAWNLGKKKPYADQYGDLWCDFDNPKLISNYHGRGQASCMLCGYPWFH